MNRTVIHNIHPFILQKGHPRIQHYIHVCKFKLFLDENLKQIKLTPKMIWKPVANAAPNVSKLGLETLKLPNKFELPAFKIDDVVDAGAKAAPASDAA